MAALIAESKDVSGTNVKVSVKLIPEIDPLQAMVPANNFVSSRDVIPGIVGEKFERPERPLKVMEKTPLFIHNIEFIASLQLEKELESIISKMIQSTKMTTKGELSDNHSLQVFVSERILVVKCHNTWKQTGDQC